MKNKFKFLKRMFVIITALIGGFLLLLACVLVIYSPGKPEQFSDMNGKQIAGSISEKVFISVGGVKQGMFIRSKDINRPVLLYLHGGPAFPNYFLVVKFKPGLEDFFTVCYWEQRGGGLSYSPEVANESMSFGQLASDAIEVTNYLRKRFKKEKIYLIAHSGGTPIALMAISRHPEMYEAYIAMAQITQQKESEIIAYNYMSDQYANTGNRKKARALKEFSILESDSILLSYYKSGIRDQFMHELGIGTMHKMKSIFWDIFLPVWTCKAYTLREKVNIWKSKFSFLSKTNLNKEVLTTDFAGMAPKLDVPVYFFSGKFDMTVNIDLSKAYYDQLQAPLKGFYTFNNSAHSPLFEEPLLARQIIEHDVLKGNIHLADKE